MLKNRRALALAAAASIMAAGLAAPVAADAFTYVTRAQATVTLTERSDWQIVQPDRIGCAPVGGGSQVLRARTAGSPSTLLKLDQVDSHHQPAYSILAPVHYTVQRDDATTQGPPLDPESPCDPPPAKDCRGLDLGRHRAGVSALPGTGHVNADQVRVQDSFQNCWAPPADAGEKANARAVKLSWPRRMGGSFHPGLHRLTVTRQLPAETIDDGTYGRVRNLVTVSLTMTYRVPASRAGRCHGVSPLYYCS